MGYAKERQILSVDVLVPRATGHMVEPITPHRDPVLFCLDEGSVRWTLVRNIGKDGSHGGDDRAIKGGGYRIRLVDTSSQRTEVVRQELVVVGLGYLAKNRSSLVVAEDK